MTRSLILARRALAPRRGNFRRFQSTVPASTASSATTTAPSTSDASTHSEVATIPPPSEIVSAHVVSGAPSQLQHRLVRIYVPTRNTMQSGGAKGEKWRIDFDTLPSGGRWENPLMGWASSADYNQMLRMSFEGLDDAIRFAEKQGWSFYVQQPTVKRIPPKNYSENYVYKPHKLRIARTK